MHLGYVLIIGVMALSVPNIYGETDLAERILLEVEINNENKVHVKHEVGSSNSETFVMLLDGEVSDVTVTGKDGSTLKNDLEYIDGQAAIRLPNGKQNVFVEYDLAGVLFNDGGVWSWTVNHPGSVRFSLPEDIELAFINDASIYLEGTTKIGCNGCNMILSYADWPKSTQSISWEEHEFDVTVRTFADVGELEFNQPSKSISFDYSGAGEFVILEMPQELLADPYRVWLDDDQIFKDAIPMDDGTIWISIRPDNDGRIQIVGTSVIPEIPTAMVILVMVAGISVAIIAGTRNNLRIR